MAKTEAEIRDADKGFEIDKGVFYPPAILLVIALAIGLIAPEGFAKGADAVLNFTIEYFGWFYMLAAFILLAFAAIVCVSPVGKIRLGGPDAEPELGLWEWFTIALCAGIAIGIVFWGVAEPLYHFNGPPSITGAEAQSSQAAIRALQISYFHWSFHPYAMYSVIGLAIAFATYNLDLPFKVSSALYPLIGDRIHGFIGKAVDSISVFAIAGGVITSLGFGTMQLAGGLNYIFGIEQNMMTYIAIVVVITAVYTISSYTGLERGIKLLSDNNAKIFFGLIAFVFLLGPTKYLLELGVNSFGCYLDNIISMSFWADPYDQSGGWLGNWTVFYWAWWFAFTPIVGMFLAQISYGRTIREFLLVNVAAPALFGILWFTTFGGTAIHLDSIQGAGIMNAINQSGVEVSLYTLLDQFPLSMITNPLAVITISISFITLADSMTSSMSLMSVKSDKDEAPGTMKIFWGSIMGALTILFLMAGGTQGLQTSSVVTAFPIIFLQLGAVISLILAFNESGYRPN